MQFGLESRLGAVPSVCSQLGQRVLVHGIPEEVGHLRVIGVVKFSYRRVFPIEDAQADVDLAAGHMEPCRVA